MYCTRKITDDLTWVGANDRRLAMFEGVYSVPGGVSYNSYLLKDEKTVLFDTVDKAVRQRFLENITEALGGRELDFLIVQHMEPDHSAAIEDIVRQYPGVQVVCNEKTEAFLEQFLDFDVVSHTWIVKEGDSLNTGKHTLNFLMAPMVHWPEVMVTYDSVDKILFSADAFGCFGALNGALFADEVDFERDYIDEARRYYTNIVGKYGTQVQALLGKASGVEINMICPLHGFVWRRGFGDFIEKYDLWSRYEPEDKGVMIAYASVYGNTENTAEILACRLRERGIATVMFDVSVSPASDIVSAAFRWSHLVFASTTYNAGIFVTMEAVISDLVSHNIQNRTVAVIENGSWAPTAGGLIREKLSKCRNMNILNNGVSIRSALKRKQLSEIDTLCDAIAVDFPQATGAVGSDLPAGGAVAVSGAAGTTAGGGKTIVDKNALFKLSYGLFVLSAKDGDKDNGCIINTAAQVTDTPLRISITVNKSNLTHDMILKTGVFNLSILSEAAEFSVFKQFGFQSGRDADKFYGIPSNRTENGLLYVTEAVSGIISGKVAETLDCGTHTLLIADVTQSFVVSSVPSVTYQYYFEHIKPKPAAPAVKKSGYVCKICGYVYEGDELPDDFICPLCKHGASDFEKL